VSNFEHILISFNIIWLLFACSMLNLYSTLVQKLHNLWVSIQTIKVIYLLKLKYYNINSRINEQNTCKFNTI